MYSFLLPTNIEIYQNPDFLKLEGPFGTLIKKTGGQEFKIITVNEGRRLFSITNNSTSLSKLFQIIIVTFCKYHCNTCVAQPIRAMTT